MTYVRANVEMLVTNVTNYNIYVTNPLTGASTYFDKHYLNSCVVKSIKEVLPC